MHMKALPRYRMRETAVGCAEHSDPDCLCDVIIDKPAPIYRGPLMMSSIALDAIDADMVDRRNIVEFYCALLGAYELYCRTVAEEDDVARDTTARVGGVMRERDGKRLGPDVWWQLSEEQRQALRHHYTIGSDWAIACAEIEGVEIAPKDMTALRKFYSNGRSSAFHNRARRNGNTRKLHCEYCGVAVFTRSHAKRFCSDNCRVYNNRQQHKGEQS